MKRREFIGLVGAGVAAWPLAGAERKLPTIGYLGAASSSIQSRWTTALLQRLRELGWIEGRTVAIEVRWADGRGDRYAEIAAEFVRLKVDVIVTSGGSLVAAKQATSAIPIVFALASDPIGDGLDPKIGTAGRKRWPVGPSTRSCR